MGGFIKLRIVGEGLDIQRVSDKLGRAPDFSYKKGDIYFNKITKSKTVYQENCWMAEAEKKEHETLDECVEVFILGFFRTAKQLKEISEKFSSTFWISAYPENEQSTIHLSKKVIFALGEMGVPVDFTVAFLKDFYDGSYMDKV